MQAALSFSASVAASPLRSRPAPAAARPVAPPPRRATRSAARAPLAVRAAAAGKTYICIDCGWLYVPDKQKGVSFESLKSFNCPACSSGKNRFKVYNGAVPRGNPNSGAALKARLSELSGGGPRVARAAEGAGVEKGDSGALVAGAVGIAAVAAGLYAYLNASF